MSIKNQSSIISKDFQTSEQERKKKYYPKLEQTLVSHL